MAACVGRTEHRSALLLSFLELGQLLDLQLTNALLKSVDNTGAATQNYIFKSYNPSALVLRI
jgi:hypothetical protein